MTAPGTEQGQAAAAIWRETSFARDWAAGDSFRDQLAFPRQMAAVIIAGDNPEPGTVVDIGAGPGDFLAVMLEQFPGARGVWTDASEPMLDLARERLAPFGDRVTFEIVDMTALDGSPIPAGADIITTSRAAHHLDAPGLAEFYTAAGNLLAPGGWLVNLDHIGPPDEWNTRLRAARKQFGAPSNGPAHHHNYPLTSVDDHLRALAAAGFTDVEVAWRAFFTCLFMARKDS
ncbi:MAG TPA: class I SAM-dependent methyltransferase [Streptosporangiaceae bacterium]|jgi:SAM-dependent methyltransferase|nr:class I SAM-dependent methyltransferase [Streptosporangiaceae bacterium]